MNDLKKDPKVQSFKQKLLFASKEEIIDLLVEKIKELAEAQDLYRLGFQKDLERTKKYEGVIADLNEQLIIHTTTLKKIHNLLDEEGQIYPDMSLESCVQGVLVENKMLREDLESFKKQTSEARDKTMCPVEEGNQPKSVEHSRERLSGDGRKQ